ncbi:MAG TPA: hypothetical protein VE397_01645, partial [Stellaceae bacterium]|nr:hypothetical protein [Stellaceae bacterium]
MLSSDKRASLTSGLLAAKDQALPGEEAADSPPPSASLFSLPRAGARQRLIGSAARAGETAASDSGAAESAPPAAPEPASSEPSESTESSEPVLYSKGDASASGFRPWYWSYDRDGDAADGDGRVARFPAAAAA